MGELGKIFLLIGAGLMITGAMILLMAKIPSLGKLPGDIVIKRENFSFYFPLTTCLLLSLILSLLFRLWPRK